jgi:cellulose synthase (UDP-forming)
VATVNSFCHLLAVSDALRNQVQNWVPTGATGSVQTRRPRSGVPQRVAWMARTWLLVTQLLLWVGLERHISRAPNPWLVWPALALGAMQLWMLLPLVIELGPAGDTYPSITDPTDGVVASRDDAMAGS